MPVTPFPLVGGVAIAANEEVLIVRLRIISWERVERPKSCIDYSRIGEVENLLTRFSKWVFALCVRNSQRQ